MIEQFILIHRLNSNRYNYNRDQNGLPYFPNLQNMSLTIRCSLESWPEHFLVVSYPSKKWNQHILLPQLIGRLSDLGTGWW